MERGVATIRDVAQLAGVSTATVSHVLNNTRAVSDGSRDRVLAAMEQLHYQPNAVARSLRMSETLTIGLIVPDVEIPFFAWVARCIEASANEAGYNVILCNSGWSLNRELLYLDNLLARRVDGLICISLSMTSEHVAPMLKRHAPVVWFEQTRSGGQSDAVIIDNFKGAYAATAHLIAQGHRRIGCILGLDRSQLTVDRLAGYRQALKDNGLSFDEALLCPGDYTPPTGLAAAHQLLALREPPSAIFAYNDMMALGAMQAINERGLRIPDDIAIIGFDGIALTKYSCPPISTVEQPIPEMCRLAIRMLLDRINDRAPMDARTVVVEPRLICRSSTLGRTPALTADAEYSNPT
jgi:LacI family transcriptional regulator